MRPACLALATAVLCGGIATTVESQERRPGKALPPALQESGDRAREGSNREDDAPPRTRVRLFLDDTVLSPMLPARVAFSAALAHRSGKPKEWGRGPDDFGKRMAASAGQTLAQSGVQHATAALLRVDPRGEREACRCAHPLRRTVHALAKTVVTRDERGRLVPNVPLFAGAYGGAMIATAWYPSSHLERRDAARVATFTVVGRAGANVFREFAPELKRLVPGRRDKANSR